MKMTNDRAAFYGILGETIDIYQAEHAVVAAYHELGGRATVPGRKYRIVVGHDQSPASDMMEAAVCAALCAAGADVVTLGAVPSGAVSYLTAKADALMGVMITGNWKPWPAFYYSGSCSFNIFIISFFAVLSSRHLF